MNTDDYCRKKHLNVDMSRPLFLGSFILYISYDESKTLKMTFWLGRNNAIAAVERSVIIYFIRFSQVYLRF